MKATRITLLILIIVGIIAIATQKIWVPKLVAHIIAKEQLSKNGAAESATIQPVVTLQNGRQCYTYSHAATSTEPYAVSEFIDLTIKGTTVTGTKKGTQRGPDMDNGYQGIITGTLANNSISDVFSYSIEGSSNKEKELYRASVVGIEKLRYPLVEQGGMLIPDTTKAFTGESYARVNCTASN